MIKKWKIIKSEPLSSNRVFSTRKDTSVSPITGEEHEFFVIEAPDWVNVVAVTDRDEVLLIRQYRHGIESETIEIPGGCIDRAETPLEAAKRELLEETGYAGNVRYVVPKVVHSAYSDMQRHVFVVENCTQIQEPSPDDSEFIDVVLMSLDDFRNHLRAGQLSDVGSGYLALDFLDLL